MRGGPPTSTCGSDHHGGRAGERSIFGRNLWDRGLNEKVRKSPLYIVPNLETLYTDPFHPISAVARQSSLLDVPCFRISGLFAIAAVRFTANVRSQSHGPSQITEARRYTRKLGTRIPLPRPLRPEAPHHDDPCPFHIRWSCGG